MSDTYWNIGMAICLGTIILLCYGNSFDASWHHDDYNNIVKNVKVHMNQWTWVQIKQSLTAGFNNQIVGRPLAYFSFALNYKTGGLNVFGYHVVNIIIHWIASIFLFLFIRDTLRLPILKDRYSKNATLIAAMAASFWAIHPIQVTAVTYIVQRMASMAGMFYIMAMYLFLKLRTSCSLSKRMIFFILCCICVTCALLTKENTIVLGYAFLLYDLLLIQGISKKLAIKSLLKAGGITLVAGLIGLLYTDMNLGSAMEYYDIRPFTPIERMLTQPRVILLYLSLIAIPMTSRMAILHDIEISHSFLVPWQTGLSIIALSIIILSLLLMMRKYPLFAFCGLFFFLNHVVEGSFLNLELIYEHRNYIPSMLLFVIPAIAAVKSLAFFNYRRTFQWMIGMGVLLLLISQGYTTIAYNRIYKTELSLWLHTMLCSPNLSLTHSNLGSVYWNLGLLEKANEEFEKARDLDRYINSFHKGAVYYNLGLYAAYRQQDYQKALDYFIKAKEYYHQNYHIWYHAGLIQIVMGEGDAALKTITTSLERWPVLSDFNYLLGLTYLKNDRCDAAVQEAKKVINLHPKHRPALMLISQGYRCKGDLDRAINYLEEFMTLAPNDILGMLALIELYDAQNQTEAAKAYMARFNRLRKGVKVNDILHNAKESGVFGAYVPDVGTIEPLIRKYAHLLESGSD